MYFVGEEFLYVTPIDQDTIVRVTINGKKPAINKGWFFIRILQKTLLPQGNSAGTFDSNNIDNVCIFFSGYPDSVSEDYCGMLKHIKVKAFY